jgi:hypothetical protein
LRSRFTTVVQFPDFSGCELAEIMNRQAQQEKFVLPPLVLADILESLEAARMNSESLGNARQIRSLFEQMKINLAVRIMKETAARRASDLSKDELCTFTLEDLPQNNQNGNSLLSPIMGNPSSHNAKGLLFDPIKTKKFSSSTVQLNN